MQSGLCVHTKDIRSCQVTHLNSYQPVRTDPSLEKLAKSHHAPKWIYSYEDFLLDNLNPV